jgi:hypothetical protein
MEHQRQYTDGKLDNVMFELTTKVRLDDMKQNFKQLNDLLLVKFKQVE